MTHLLPMRSLKPWGIAADVFTASDIESNLFWFPTSVPGGGGCAPVVVEVVCCPMDGISLPVIYLTFSNAPGW